MSEKNEKLIKFIKDINNENYRFISPEKKNEIQKKVDNFFEILYLAPELIDNDVIMIMKERENKLNNVKLISAAIGFSLFSIPYSLYRLKRGFYFRNFWIMIFCGMVVGYGASILGEYYYNNKNYKYLIMKLALSYNISDEEILELHTKINEWVLNENKREEHKKFSLDKVKIKF